MNGASMQIFIMNKIAGPESFGKKEDDDIMFYECSLAFCKTNTPV